MHCVEQNRSLERQRSKPAPPKLKSPASEWLAHALEILHAVVDALEHKFKSDRNLSRIAPEYRTQFAIPYAAVQAVLGNDATTLHEAATQLCGLSRTAVLRALLHLATVHQASACCDVLVPRTSCPQDLDDSSLNEPFRSGYLQHLVVQRGRENIKDGKAELTKVLDALHESERWVLGNTDRFERLPLHYAATCGLVDASREILFGMDAWDISASWT